jgi:hypothetical protein
MQQCGSGWGGFCLAVSFSAVATKRWGSLAYCGRTDAALRMLSPAIKGGYCAYPAMDSDPFFASLRTNPEFVKLRSAAMKCQQDFLAQRGQ